MNFSVVILTYNEEKNIRACLDTLKCCDDVAVIDSFSADSTLEIARESGARVFEHEFRNFATQRNWAMDTIDFKHSWIFHLDADERFTPELAGECEDVVHEDLYSGYMVAGKLMFMGKWLKWSAGFPVYQMRLAKRGEIRFKQVGHGQQETGAQRGVGYLKYSYLHFPFKKGLPDWYDKHAAYAKNEARHVLGEKSDDPGSDSLLAADPVHRRRALKRMSRKLPGRPLLRFLYMYVLKLGVLDGTPGYRYCRMMAEFESMISTSLSSLKQAERSD